MSKSLYDWDAELPESILKNQQRLHERRAFLSSMAAVSVAATICPSVALTRGGGAQHASSDKTLLNDEPWKTIAVVQEHLFPPTDDSPGASDLNATQYLKDMLAAPDMDKDDRDFIKNGIKWLDGIANDMHGGAFIQLIEKQREAVLRHIAQSRAGENWLASLLLYIFEALLTAPVYGGNPDGIGWQWLEYQPGFPLPPTEKKYFNL